MSDLCRKTLAEYQVTAIKSVFFRSFKGYFTVMEGNIEAKELPEEFEIGETSIDDNKPRDLSKSQVTYVI
jgi:hypothetical protein